MYGALWRILPGPVWLRVVILIILAVVVLWALVTWVFPWVDSLLGPQEGTVGP
jgi:membrane protein implicated in regulation of membrane protease activity